MKTRTDTTPINTSAPDIFHLGGYGRIFLLALSLINLILGIVFYISPGAVIPYWPWPVKELATRFLGAIFLAISLGCWSAIQAKLWQRAKILVLVGGSFFGLTGIVSIVRGATVSGNAAIWIWTGYFLAASTGCLILLVWHKNSSGHGKFSRLPCRRSAPYSSRPAWRQGGRFSRKTLPESSCCFPSTRSSPHWP
ncbi:hypothetical protein E6H25_07445 [Candidatus Bathyarchaeota archaeon]|nr:MAG: hypothetical protein E6H25_07445 [Candidatus Bathyarchaeota archaeon]